MEKSMEKFHGKKESFFYKMFFSYFVIIMIALSLVVINVFKTSAISGKQDEEYYVSNLKVVQDLVETKIASVRNMFVQITNYNWAENLTFISQSPGTIKDKDDLNSYDTFEAIRNLSHHKNTVGGVEALGIFYKKGDFVIDQTSITHAPDYFRDIFRMDGFDANNWYSLANTFQSFNLLPNNGMTFNGKRITGTTFYKTIPPNDSNVSGLVFAVINREAFNSVIQSLAIDQETYGMIVDDNNTVIASTKNYVPGLPLPSYANLEADGSYRSVNDNEYAYYAGKMNFLPWKIVLITKPSAVPSFLSLPGYYMLAVLLILFSSVAAAYIMSIYSYKPLRQLESQISGLNARQLRLQRQIDAHKADLADRRLIARVNGEASADDGEDEAAFVIAFDLQGDSSSRETGRRVLVSLQKWLRSLDAAVRTVNDAERRSVLFVWLPESAGYGDAGTVDSLTAQIAELKRKLETKHAIKLRLGIGADYKQAVASFKYDAMFNAVVYFADAFAGTVASRTLPLETERKIANYMKVGEFEKIHELISELIAPYADAANWNGDESAVLYGELAAILVKQCEAADLKALIRSRLEDSPPGNMESLVMLYKEVCDSVALNDGFREDERRDVKAEVLHFIEQNYLNPGMSLQLVKDRFHISFALITRIVKQQSGYGFLEYLSRIRLDYAKKLLRGTDESITRIREITGFNDDSNFIKVFKKYEGITPGEYKKKTSSARREKP